MKNPFITELLEHDRFLGLTFDDVSLVTQYADFLPNEANISTQFSRNIKLNIPFVSAAMDTVTESAMAIIMARLGGIGVIHKNMTSEEQAHQVSRVKHHSNGLIQSPITFNAEDTVFDILETKETKRYPFSGFPIVDNNGKVVGIFTAKDMKFASDKSSKIKDVMTSEIITAPEGTNLQQAYKIMIQHKIGKLPVVNSNGELKGLYSFHDVDALNSDSMKVVNLDEKYQLRVAAAMSPYDFERADLLINAGVDALVLDTAHGHSKGVIETVKELKNKYTGVDIIAGNIGTEEAAADLVKAGADGVKVGIGPGSICTTRVVAGVGIPQISAVYLASKGTAGEIPVIADGGIKQSGDVAKAIAVGANSVMMGSLLAATEESPGEKIIHQGRRFVVYRGMGSLEAMKAGQGSKERYSQGDITDPSQLVPQGVEGRVPFRGGAATVLHQFAGGLKFSLGYCGAKDIETFQKTAKLTKVSPAGLREAHPHDIQIIRDAPNYRTM